MGMLIKNLCLNIDNTCLLKNINFEIEKSEIVAIVGESGSGKTLTSKFMLGILPERSIISYDEYVNDLKIGVIFQNSFSSFNPTLRIEKQLLALYESHYHNKNWKNKVCPLLHKVGLKNIEKILKQYSFETSGGERQRLAIAGALIGDPDLLICDEVTTALDLKNKNEVINFLKNLRKETGKSIIFITHDIDSIRNFADRVYVMYKGEIIETNGCRELFEKQKHPYVQKLIEFGQNLWKRG